MSQTETRRMVTAAVAACEDKKAEQIHILELDPADSGFTDYFLICSGNNDRQNQTIASAIEDSIEREFNTRPNSVEGYRQGEWILLDYVDFVVHIFSKEKREFYGIERLRKTAKDIDLDQLKASLTTRVAAARKKQPAKTAAAKKTAAKKSSKKAAAKTAVKKPTVAAKSSALKPTRKTAVKKAAAKKAATKKSPAKKSRRPSK